MGSVAANHPAVKRTTIINNPDPAGRTFAKSTFQSFRLIRPRAPNAFGPFLSSLAPLAARVQGLQGSIAQVLTTQRGRAQCWHPMGRSPPAKRDAAEGDPRRHRRQSGSKENDHVPGRHWTTPNHSEYHTQIYTIHHGTITIKIDVEAVESRAV